MSKGLSLTRNTTQNNNELFFLIEDSNGNIIPIKQTFTSFASGQIRMSIVAGESVTILRGELMTKAKR